MDMVKESLIDQDELKQLLFRGRSVLRELLLCSDENSEQSIFSSLYDSGELNAMSESTVYIYSSLLAMVQETPFLFTELWESISSLSAFQGLLAVTSAKLSADGQSIYLLPMLFEAHWNKVERALAQFNLTDLNPNSGEELLIANQVH